MMTELEAIGLVAVGFSTTFAALDIVWRLARRKKALVQDQKEVAITPLPQANFLKGVMALDASHTGHVVQKANDKIVVFGGAV